MFRNLFRRRTASDAARELARAGVEHRRARIRAKVDEMRRGMGLPAVDWGKL